jgi:hypothetical protein
MPAVRASFPEETGVVFNPKNPFLKNIHSSTYSLFKMKFLPQVDLGSSNFLAKNPGPAEG